jgi:hypothetical protein
MAFRVAPCIVAIGGAECRAPVKMHNAWWVGVRFVMVPKVENEIITTRV